MPVVITGLAELRAALRQAADASPREVTKALKAGAVTVTARAVALAPRKTGALAGTARPYATQKAAGVRFSSPYAGVAEFKRGGAWTASYGQTPRFAFKAVDQLAESLVDSTMAALTEVLKCNGWFTET